MEVWKDWKGLAGRWMSLSKPAPGVRGEWIHTAWIPLTCNGAGDYHCVDLAPAKGGRVGQIIEVWHNVGDRLVLAPSFRGWPAKFADDLERGHYDVTPYGLSQRTSP